MNEAQRTNTIKQQNESIIAGFNRENRRKANRLIQKGYDDYLLAHELKRLQQSSQTRSPLIRAWKKILAWWRRKDPYYVHIPKQVRPMVCTGYKEGIPIMVADHMSCEKIRKKLSK